MKKYQTLSEFMAKPFGQANSDRDLTYISKYRAFSSSNKLKINAMTILEDSYYIHIKVPSESNDGKQEYDVVIRFFTEDPQYLKDLHLRNYNIQFFSNSPGFIYKYAYVYEQKGFLIEALYNKLDPSYRGKAPEKTNANLDLSYDKSIYFACRFLLDNQFSLLAKNGSLTMYKKSLTTFLRGISDFQSIKMDQDLLNEEKKLSKELDIESKKKLNRLENDRKKKASDNTYKDKDSNHGITIIRKKGAKGAKAKIVAKRGKKSTFKNKK